MMYERSILVDGSSTRFIKRLIWLYFWLLIFEGALRKWVFPGQANALLIVRDPVLLLIYYEAFKKKVFPKNWFIVIAIILAVLSFMISILNPSSSLLVALYGVRVDFLHIPLIFLMAQAFNYEDVKTIGKWVLVLSIPMSMLLVMQFLSPPTHPLNNAATEGMTQIGASVEDIIRPAGTFSYSNGVTQFVSLAFSFFFYGIFSEKRPYHSFLIIFSIVAVGVSMVVSGSRGLIMNVAIVFLSATYAGVNKPFLVGRFMKWFIVSAVVVAFILPFLVFFEKGVDVLAFRFSAEGGIRTGIIQRFIDSTIGNLDLVLHSPVLGYGIGLGTNAGAVLLTGKREFLLAENEWERIFMESGVILGTGFILLRIAILIFILKESLEALRKNNFLPLLLLGSGAVAIFSGQWGQPATLGFAVFNAGLCLAACKTENT